MPATTSACLANDRCGLDGGDAGGQAKSMDEFEQQLYTWLALIPAGCVVTYGQLAQLIGRPGGARWVGRKMGALPAGSSLPWHRVLNARGGSSLPLDKGGSNRQLRLLQREGVLVVGGRVSLTRYRWRPLDG